MKKEILKILRSIIFAIILSVALPSFSQDINIKQLEKVFLPEGYVKGILSTHLKKNIPNKEQPIEAIIIIKGRKYIQTYGGKLSPAHTRKNSNGETELIYVHRLLNLLYFEEDDFKNVKFFIKQTNDKLSIDIVDNGERKTIPFISSINGYQFEFPRFSYVKLLLNGSYVLLDNGNKSNITFDLNGQISNNEHWSKYLVDRVYMFRDRQDTSFHSITLLSKKGGHRLNLAFTYLDDTKSWEGFSFETVKGNVIVLKNGKTIKLIRNQVM